MKKIFSTLFLLLLLCGNAVAAPYHMDAPIDSYSWGESMKTVWQTREKEGNEWRKISDEMIFIIPQDTSQEKSAVFMRFWKNRLFQISKSDSPSEMTPEESERIYRTHLDEFTTKWGKPVQERACPGNSASCMEVVWYPNEVTRVSLYRSNGEEKRPFVGYSYASREMHLEYEKEFMKYGSKYPAYVVLSAFRNDPGHIEKNMQGKRVRIEGQVVSTSPLLLKENGDEVTCSLRDSKEAKKLQVGQVITVSGVVDGIRDDTLLLSDVISVPYPEDEQIRINRAGKKPRGFFPAEAFYQQLEKAANQVEKGFSIREFTAPPRIDGNRVIVDIVSDEIEGDISFSLESLLPDRSANTIAFNMNLKEDQGSVNGYFVMAVVSIVLKATQPEASLDTLWNQLEDSFKQHSRNGYGGGRITINDWTYQLDFRSESNMTFSATTQKRRK